MSKPESDPNAAGASNPPTNDDDNQTETSFSPMDMFQKLMTQLNLKSEDDTEEENTPEQLLPEVSFQGVADYMLSEKCKKVIVMCGAGISTSAGIPDFRTPGTGLYDNLQKYELPNPQAIFEIGFFKKNPNPFYTLAKELYPGNFKPTWSHYFVKMLEKKGLLARVYTQNIDTLERVAGVSGDKIVEAHGTFHLAHCVEPECNKEFTQEWVKEKIFNDEIPHCPICESVVKPDIVFFGEALPKRFFELRHEDFNSCDLLIVMGTSLKVQPFASLVGTVSEITPRLLINREKCGQTSPMLMLMGMGGGMDFDSEKAYRDVAWLGDCDDGCRALCVLLGWKDEFEHLVQQEHSRIDKQSAQAKKSNTTKTEDPQNL